MFRKVKFLDKETKQITPDNYDQYVRQCRGKEPLRAIYQALEMIESLNKKNPNDVYNWYICKFCAHIHVGHKLGTKKNDARTSC
jgi:hypothetical protein